MFHSRLNLVAAAVLFGFAHFSQAAGPQSIVITPTTFDFGWAPDNAKISADFTVKNTGIDMIPITNVQPTCGCTATQFTPDALSTNEETKIGLTFNTRGYKNTAFSKSTKIKTDSVENEYNVILKGFVTDSNAKVVPDQDGIATFDSSTKDKKKTIKIENKGPGPVSLSVVQKSADWAAVKLPTTNIQPNASVPLEIVVNGPYDEVKETSVTLEAKSETESSRLTVAIRTGLPPTPVRIPSPIAVPTSVKPTGK